MTRINMKKIRNIQDLKLVKQKLKYKQKLYEKDVLEASGNILNIFTLKLQDIAFSLGSKLFFELFKSKKS